MGVAPHHGAGPDHQEEEVSPRLSPMVGGADGEVMARYGDRAGERVRTPTEGSETSGHRPVEGTGRLMVVVGGLPVVG